MNPQETTPRIPFFQRFAFEEPCSGLTMSCFQNEVVVRRWIRGREPILKRLFAVGHLQDNVGLGNESGEKQTNASTCLLRLTLGEERL
jgi:hypothetical protein